MKIVLELAILGFAINGSLISSSLDGLISVILEVTGSWCCRVSND